MSEIDFQAHGLRPAYNFDELVIGDANHIPAKACLECAKTLGELYNPLFVYGPEGTGKSHLAQATVQLVLAKNPKAKVKYITAERFINEVIAAISEDNAMALRDSYGKLDLFVMDDVQYILESKTAQSEFLHIFNILHQKNSQIVFTGNQAPAKMANLDPGLKSKMGWGLAAEIKLPDVKMRVELLKKKMTKYGVELDDAMLSYSAGKLRTSVREMEGFLKKINAYSTLSHQAVNMDLIENCLTEFIPEGAENLPPEEVPKKTAASPGSLKKEMEEMVEEAKAQAGGGHASKPRKSDSEKPPKKTLEVLMPEKGKEPEEPPKAPPEPAKPEAAAPAPPKPEPTPVEPPPAPKEETPPEPPKVEVPPAPPKDETPPEPRREVIPEMEEEPEEEETDLPKGHKEITAVFFYPQGAEEALESVGQKFQEVIKKHKLKFRLKQAGSETYECKQKINYGKFVEACKKFKAPVAIVIGPPPQAFVPEQDFYDLLSVTLDVQGISLQLVGWTEINKDYRYLNLALDIALVRNR